MFKQKKQIIDNIFYFFFQPRQKMTVTLEQGTLQGLLYKTQLSNKSYFSFLGIPYAKPPINELRFKVNDLFEL